MSRFGGVPVDQPAQSGSRFGGVAVEDVPEDQPSTSLESLAGNFAGGAVDAVLTLPGAVNDIMLMGVDKVAQQFGAKPLTPEQYANNPFGSETVRGMFKDYVSPDMFGPEAKTTAEQYARRIGEFAGPGAAFAPARLMKPALTAAVTGGVGSKAAQDAFPDNPWAPVIGGVVGGLTPSAVSAARSMRVPTAGMTPQTAKLAQEMIDEGIDIFPGQVGSNATKATYDAVSKVPFTGTGKRANQLRQFNAAIAKTFGEVADAITPEVMSRAKSRIGKEFNRIFANNDIIADQKLLDDLADVQLRATTNLTDAQANDIGKAITSIMNETAKGGGVLNGRKYSAFTSKGGALQNLTSSADPNIKFYAGQVRDMLDDAFSRSAKSADDVTALQTAKQQYRAMKVIQDLVPKAADGNISPALLLGKVMGNDKGMAYTGGGKLGTLARGGQKFLKDVSGSQTAERNLLYTAMGGAGAAAFAPQVLAPAAAVWGISKGVKSLLESRKMGARMVAEALKKTSMSAQKASARQRFEQGARGSLPGAAGVAGRGQSVERTPPLLPPPQK